MTSARVEIASFTTASVFQIYENAPNVMIFANGQNIKDYLEIGVYED